MFFEGTAWAQSAAAAQPTNLITQLLYGPTVPFALLIIAFYWFFIRPQTKKASEHRDMLAKLKRNDEVVMTGGLIGKVVELGDRIVTLEVAQNVRVRVERSQIAAVAPSGKAAGKKGDSQSGQ